MRSSEKKWKMMSVANKKDYLLEHFFKDPKLCAELIDGYDSDTIDPYNVYKNTEYCVKASVKLMTRLLDLDFIEQNKEKVSSWDASLKILGITKQFIENNKGWFIIHAVSRSAAEKVFQRLVQGCSNYYCDLNDIDISFEPNEGPGPADIKVSRGTDKTVIEIKLSSNNDYIHGYTEKIETYAKAENTKQHIYVYVQFEEHPKRDQEIQKLNNFRIHNGENPPLLFMIDAREKILDRELKPAISKRRIIF